MPSSTLLVVSNIKLFSKTLRAVERCFGDVLYIHLNIPGDKVEPVPSWGNLISQIYTDSQNHLRDGDDIRILVSPLKQGLLQLNAIDKIFADSHAHPRELCKMRCTPNSIPVNSLNTSRENVASDLLDFRNLNQPSKTYPTVVLGGTFDRIHVGHKIFLTQAALRARNKLVVGVTSAVLTKSKLLAELILPVEQRISDVCEFLNSIDSTLEYDVQPIDDPFGPTKSDPDMDMIVVSTETLRGGHKVNELRVENNLRPLEIFCIDIIESSFVEAHKEVKISSSNKRMDLLGIRLRQPTPRPQLPKKPYIIGMTGGIASGKSKMAQRFQRLGATVLNCDEIAHDIYAPGQVCYDQIVQNFGLHITDPNNNGIINRQKLGAIVFGNAQKLEELNNIVWPQLWLEVKRRIATLQQKCSDTQVVIVEAAVLLTAGWETECHEVWSMIVPTEIAVQRLMERNGLTEDEARRRRATQCENSEIVGKSHVVFSSQWDEAFTQQQAARAWKMLMAELAGGKTTKSVL